MPATSKFTYVIKRFISSMPIACAVEASEIININESHSLEPLLLYAIDLHKYRYHVRRFFFVISIPIVFAKCHKLNDCFLRWPCSMHCVFGQVRRCACKYMEIPIETYHRMTLSKMLFKVCLPIYVQPCTLNFLLSLSFSKEACVLISFLVFLSFPRFLSFIE